MWVSQAPVAQVFVGRETELAALRGLEARADDGTATVAVITGEAGIGKSALVEQFGEGIAAEATTVWGNCSSAAAQNLPFGPWIEALTSLTRRLSPAFVTEVLGPSAPVLASLIPALAPVGDDPDQGTQGQVTQGQLFEAATRLLLRTAERRTVVVVLEDLHWSDESTRGLLEYVVRSARHERLMIVVTVRSDDPSYEAIRPYLSELASLPSVTHLEMSRFAAEEVADQLTGLKAMDVTADRLADVMTFSEGVPFLVEQVVAANLDVHQLQGAVADRLLGHRIAALPDGARTVVEVAAIGRPPADVHAAARVSGLDDDTFDLAVEDAEAAGILSEQGDRLAFRHALLLEAAQQRMPPRRRRRLHAGWAQAIEAAPSVGDAATLAEHWSGAGEPANALVPTLQAAAEAKRLSAVDEQLRLLTEAARLWDLAPDPAEKTSTDQWSILAEAAELALRTGDVDLFDRLVAKARLALDTNATVRAAWLDILALWALMDRGEDVSIGKLQTAVSRIPSDPPTRHRVIACKLLAGNLLHAGRIEEALPVVSEGVAAAEARGDLVLQADILGSQALIEGTMGLGDAALASVAKAHTLADRSGDLRARADVHMGHGVVLFYLGEISGCLDITLTGVELLGGQHPGPLPFPWSFLALNAAEGLLDLGRWDEADAWLKAVATAPGLPSSVTSWEDRLSLELAIWRGQLDPSELAPLPELDQDTLDLDDSQIQSLLPDHTSAAEIYYALGDLDAARQVVAPILRLARVTAAPAFLWPILHVAVRAEADLARAGSPNADTVGQIAGLADQTRPSSQRDRAYAATVRADLDICRGWMNRDDCEDAVALWRETPMPAPLAWSLRRLGQVSAAQDDIEHARSSFEEALAIFQGLGAERLCRAVIRDAAHTDIRLTRPRKDPAPPGASLTRREYEVLTLLDEGASNDEIAGRLFISPKTASVHVTHILAKLNVTSRGKAAAAARRAGILEDRIDEPKPHSQPG